MKLAITFLTVLDVTIATPRSSVQGNLGPALEKLMENVDTYRLAELIIQLALGETQDGRELLEHLRGPEHGAAIDAVKVEPVTDALLTYFENNVLPEAILDLGFALGIPPSQSRRVRTKSLSDLIDEFLSVFDINGLLEDFLSLVATDQSVADLLNFLQSDQVEAGYLRLKANPAIWAITARLREEGIDWP